MVRLFIFIMLVIIAISCDNSKDYYEGINQKPVIEFDIDSINKSYIKDSLKLGKSYLIGYKIIDEEHLALSLPKSDDFTITADSSTITIQSNKKGKTQVILKAYDSFLSIGEATIDLTIFENLPPVAIFSYSIAEFDGSYSLILDGSSSYDQDSKYGGYIMHYEFTINNNTILSTSLSKYTYSVNKDYTYTVKFRVQDDNGAWSNEILNYIKI